MGLEDFSLLIQKIQSVKTHSLEVIYQLSLGQYFSVIFMLHCLHQKEEEGDAVMGNSCLLAV